MARWVAEIQKFTFTLKHKSGQLLEVVNALSYRSTLLTFVRSEVIKFDYLKDIYADDEDFQKRFGPNAQMHMEP